MRNRIDIISLNKRAWNNLAERYEQIGYGKINPLVEYFCEKLPKSGYILDLGSGTGIPYTKFMIERGFRVLGIDISEKMIEIAQKNVPQATFKQLSMTNINFENEFNGVFSSYSMLLLNPPLFRDVAKRIVCSLKNRGLFYLSLNEPRIKNVNLDDEVFIEIMGAKMYSRPYTEEEVLEIFKPLGMNHLKIYREVQSSKEFGVEYMIAFIFEKI
ncbi:MAG: class I SAM-dependent DNA methyltransferase [Promethearchaeota archaeon]